MGVILVNARRSAQLDMVKSKQSLSCELSKTWAHASGLIPAARFSSSGSRYAAIGVIGGWGPPATHCGILSVTSLAMAWTTTGQSEAQAIGWKCSSGLFSMLRVRVENRCEGLESKYSRRVHSKDTGFVEYFVVQFCLGNFR